MNKTLSPDIDWTRQDSAGRGTDAGKLFGDENAANIRQIRASIGRYHLTRALVVNRPFDKKYTC